MDVRDFLGGRLEEVPQDAAQHGLVGDGEDVGFALELREDRNEAIHDVYVRFALGVAVLELLTVTQGKFAGVSLLEFLIGKALAFAL